MGVMMDAKQYRVLFAAQAVRDSLLERYQQRAAVLETAHRTDRDHLALLERKGSKQEADLAKLQTQLSSQNHKGKLLTTLGVIVGAATTYILVRKR